MTKTYNILSLGASYGSLLAANVAFMMKFWPKTWNSGRKSAMRSSGR
jgi:hypothetical protein